MTTRPPAVAGVFYPADRDRLQRQVSELLASAATPASVMPKALIAPHAGYVYSGGVAAAAFATLRDIAQTITRVVLIGPAHYVYVGGIAAPTADAFETPLGRVLVDKEALSRIDDLQFVIRTDAPHAPEHALEVELPFLQTMLPSFSSCAACRRRRASTGCRPRVAAHVGWAGDTDRRQLGFVSLPRLRDCAASGFKDCSCHRTRRLAQFGPQRGLWLPPRRWSGNGNPTPRI